MGARVLRGLGIGGLLVLVALAIAQTQTSAAPGPATPRCHLKSVKLRHHVRTVVGEMNMSYIGGTTTFTYGQGADSDISTALSVNGGPFQLGATKHVSESSSAVGSFTRKGPYSRQVDGFFTYASKRYACSNRFGPNSIEVLVEPVAWEGSIVPGRPLPSALNHCSKKGPWTTRVPRGYRFTTTSERATTWIRGATAFGVGLEATSGFSTRVSEVIQFPRRKGQYYMCGKGAAAASAPRVFTGTG